MINVFDLPCVRELKGLPPAAEPRAAEDDEPKVEYARAPEGLGYKPNGRPPAMQRNNR